MLSYIQAVDYLDDIEQNLGPSCDTAEDLDNALAEAVDTLQRRGAITAAVADKLSWQFGLAA